MAILEKKPKVTLDYNIDYENDYMYNLYVDGEMVAEVGFEVCDKEIYLFDFEVGYDHRNKGYAKLMMKKSIKSIMKKFPNRHLWLFALSANESKESNDKGLCQNDLIKFYEKLGFTPEEPDADGITKMNYQPKVKKLQKSSKGLVAQLISMSDS